MKDKENVVETDTTDQSWRKGPLLTEDATGSKSEQAPEISTVYEAKEETEVEATDVQSRSDAVAERVEAAIVEREAYLGHYRCANQFRVLDSHQDEPSFLQKLEAQMNELGAQGFDIETTIVLNGRIIAIMSR